MFILALLFYSHKSETIRTGTVLQSSNYSIDKEGEDNISKLFETMLHGKRWAINTTIKEKDTL